MRRSSRSRSGSRRARRSNRSNDAGTFPWTLNDWTSKEKPASRVPGTFVHLIDVLRVVVVHYAALELERRGELAALDREGSVEDRKLLHRLDARERAVHLV